MRAATRAVTAADLEAVTALWVAAETARKAEAGEVGDSHAGEAGDAGDGCHAGEAGDAGDGCHAAEAGDAGDGRHAAEAGDTADGRHAAEEDAAARAARRLADPTAFGVVAERAGEPVAVAVATQATADDGLSLEPVAGLAHVPMVAVRPERWGSGLGRFVVEELEAMARDRGYTRAQLWTHETNTRGRRLYERLGWVASGRTKEDEHGTVLRHYVRAL